MGAGKEIGETFLDEQPTNISVARARAANAVWLGRLEELLDGFAFGELVIKVHGGRITQVRRTEEFREP